MDQMTEDSRDATGRAERGWEASGLPAGYTAEDVARHQRDLEEYEARFGHVERRHANARLTGTLLQFLTCAAAGLLMALGFYPVITFVASVIACKAIASTSAAHASADLARRADWLAD